MADSQIITAVLKVNITAEFFDPEASEETLRACVEQDLKELYSDVEVSTLKPVRPVNVRWEMGIRGGTCPKCLNWVQRTYRYCPFCGQAVKWD